MPSLSPVGLALATLSAVLNGSWGLLAKVPHGACTFPVAFNHWAAEGVAVSGLALLLLPPPRGITVWGVASGALFVLSCSQAVLGIGRLGLAVASGVWCGTAVLVSFFFGVVVAGEPIASSAQAAAGLALLLAGTAGIAAAGAHEQRQQQHKGDGAAGTGSEQEAALLGDEDSGYNGSAGAWRRVQGTAVGLAAAVLAGLVGGLILAPLKQAPKELHGLRYLPSMAVGSLAASPPLTLLVAWLGGGGGATLRALADRRLALRGGAAGAIWNAGNAFSILAVQDPRVGLAVAYPIMQCGLFVGGAWGILLLGEMRSARARAVYWTSGVVLVAGAALLAAAK